MKLRGISFILFLFCLSNLFAQHYRVGAGFTASLPNDELKFGGGFEMYVEYKTESPFSFRTGGGFAISKFKDANPYVSDISYSLYWLEGSLIYFPIKSDFEPYLGGGIGYYFIATEEFNIIKTFAGNFEPEELSNKFSFNTKVGFIYPLSESIKLNLQAKYLWFNRKIIVHSEEIINEEIRKKTFENDLDLSSVFLTLGVVIKI